MAAARTTRSSARPRRPRRSSFAVPTANTGGSAISSCAAPSPRSTALIFDLLAERRSIFQDLKLSGWFNAFRLRGFEECEISRCKIVNPSGAGTALLVSAPGSGGQRANLHVIGCVLRGNDDVVQNAPTGLWGVQAFDVDALPAVIGGLFVFADFGICGMRRRSLHSTFTGRQWSLDRCDINRAYLCADIGVIFRSRAKIDFN